MPVQLIILSLKSGIISLYRHTNHAVFLTCSMAEKISFDVFLSLNCTKCTNEEEVLINWTATSTFWKLESGL